jgi:hypothetical protein
MGVDCAKSSPKDANPRCQPILGRLGKSMARCSVGVNFSTSRMPFLQSFFAFAPHAEALARVVAWATHRAIAERNVPS